MIALYADDGTPEGKEAIAALVGVDYVHISTSGGLPFVIWDRLCFRGMKRIRALGDTLRICNAFRQHVEAVLATRAPDMSWTPIS